MADISDVISILGDNNTQDPQILKLAQQAAQARDEAAEANAKAKLLKSELEEAMQAKSVGSVDLDDRTISFKTRNNKQKTQKAMVGILGEEAGKKLWKALPTVPSSYLDIPAAKVDEPITS
jgi:hypothetical protein